MSFYVPEGPHFAATELTRGPWHAESQHAGPPCALLGRELDRAGAIAGARVARATFEILRPVPIAQLRVSAGVVRPGRSVELVEGVLMHEDKEILRARAWRMRTAKVTLDPAPGAEDPPAGPARGEPRAFFDTGHDVGYHSAMEVRFLSGAYLEPGPARAWTRMRVPLIEGEDPSALERVLVAADSGNGVSAPLDHRRFLFINADLSVALLRMPETEWVLLDSVSRAEPDGVGMSDTLLADERGPIGRATQSLLVAER
ncbi:MAG: thioesterase family protein [Thermoleophilaceae bacterium]